MGHLTVESCVQFCGCFNKEVTILVHKINVRRGLGGYFWKWGYTKAKRA